MTNAIPITIRWMLRQDMPDVLAIENQSFQFPWMEEDFLRCSRQMSCIGLVAEHDGQIVGFVIYELHKTRLRILNCAVAAGVRRQGVGTQMVTKLAGKLSVARRTRVTLEVCETNLIAQVFLRSLGFRAVRIRRDFYEETSEAAYVMQYRLAAPAVGTALTESQPSSQQS